MRTHIAGMPVGIGGGAAEPVFVTVSIGVAVLDETRRDLTDLLASADGALYRAKQSGRDQVRMDTGCRISPQPRPVASSPTESAPG